MVSIVHLRCPRIVLEWKEGLKFGTGDYLVMLLGPPRFMLPSVVSKPQGKEVRICLDNQAHLKTMNSCVYTIS